MTPIVRFLALLTLLPLVACSSMHTGTDGGYLDGIGGPVTNNDIEPWTTVSYWDDDGTGGPAHIVVDLGSQQAKFYRGENLVGVAAISSGVEGRATPPGNYTIMEKIRDKHSTAYGHVEDSSGTIVNYDATPRSSVPPGGRYVPSPMPYWMRLTKDGVGMHQGFLPGFAASHGCIRMDKRVIAQFYSAAQVGMPVRIVGRS